MLPFNSNLITQIKKIILHVLLPNTCYACSRDLEMECRTPLCSACHGKIKPIGSLYCLRCGKPLPDGGAHCYVCRGSKAKKFKCHIIRSAVVFGPEIRRLVHAFKYADQMYLADFLAGIMHEHWTDYPPLAQVQTLLAVPLHPKKLKSRGYNQAELLAEALGKKLNLPVDKNALKRIKNTPSQTQFGREGRLENMSDAFVCPSPQQVKGKIILLIDDVATTGATLEGCAKALKHAGAKKVLAYTLARET